MMMICSVHANTKFDRLHDDCSISPALSSLMCLFVHIIFVFRNKWSHCHSGSVYYLPVWFLSSRLLLSHSAYNIDNSWKTWSRQQIALKRTRKYKLKETAFFRLANGELAIEVNIMCVCVCERVLVLILIQSFMRIICTHSCGSDDDRK